ncbi:MAG: histidine phosphatase family protein, partial [Acidimicrobiales bacterium]
MASRRTFAQVRYSPPASATEIVLVRHGETVVAEEDRSFALLDGHGDPELATAGLDQAKRVAERLAPTRVDAIYVTPLRRTAETAGPLADQLGLDPIVEPDLREVHLGTWEGGLYRQKVLENDPVAREMVARRRWDVIPGAESNEAFAARLARGIG